jgi:DNA-binding response OmpR family regulator
MSYLIAENRKLREQIDELREEKRQREATIRLIGLNFPGEWNLSRSQSVVLATLHSRSVASRHQLLSALNKYDCSTKYVDSLICQIRRKTKLPIKVVWGIGYRLDPMPFGEGKP